MKYFSFFPKFQTFILFFFSLFFIIGCRYSRGSIVLEAWDLNAHISTFGIMVGIAIIAANYILQKEFYRSGIDLILSDQIMVLTIVLGFIGARIFYVLEMKSTWNDIESFWFTFYRGGLTFYGGFLLAAIGIIIFIKNKKKNILTMADLMMPSISIGYGFGRLGCFFSGDGCYGTQCTLELPTPLCMRFPDGAYPWQKIIQQYANPNVTVYNTPLYEASFAFLLFIFFWNTRNKKWMPGIRLSIFTISYSIMRFFIEFIRRNPKDVFGITQAQFISIILLTISIIFLILYKVKFWNLSNFEK